jgi:hypothetical protein
MIIWNKENIVNNKEANGLQRDGAVGADVAGTFFVGVGAINIPWNAIWSKTIVEESQRYGLTPEEAISGTTVA